MEYIFFNGDIIEKSKAFLHVSDLSIHRGYGVFDFFKLVDFQNQYISLYLDRFYDSCDYAQLSLNYTRDDLEEIFKRVFDANNLSSGYLKLICTGGYSQNGYTPSEESNFLVFAFPLSSFSGNEQNLGRHLVMDQYVRNNPRIKSLNYFNSILNVRKMKKYDAVDVLYYYNGVLSECSRCNVFVVQDNIVKTPKRNILRGITRYRIIEQACKNGIDVLTQDVTTLELMNADEVFISSSTRGVMPVVSIEGRLVNNGKIGPISQKLIECVNNF